MVDAPSDHNLNVDGDVEQHVFHLTEFLGIAVSPAIEYDQEIIVIVGKRKREHGE